MLKMKEMIRAFKNNLKIVPFKISFLYLIISFFWILLSDRVVHDFISNSGIQLLLNTIKGWVYVIVITVFLYFILSRAFKKLESAEKSLINNFNELTKAHEELEAVNIELSASEEKLVLKYEELKLAEQNIIQSHEELTTIYGELAASDEELKLQYDQIHKFAYNDSITKLPNRLSLQEKLTEILQTTCAKVAFVFIDLDNFKYINDSFGHFFGDAVLAEIGKRLSNTVDADSFVARLGGDEFAIVMTNVEILERLKEFARDLLLMLETSFKEKDISIHISGSIGIAIYPDHADGFEELLKNADTAMYKAKKQGKNQFVIFDQSMNLELFTKVTMESNLRTAVDNNELLLYYQPVYCLKTHKIRGFEALARWNSPVYGMVSPAVFIPLAEESGLISRIGKWVLQTACKFIRRLNDSRTEKLIISVNISVYQLTHDNFVDEVLNVLNENGLNTEYLELEITESILMEDVESNLEKIDTLKKYGIRVALDDFGTGYSSLTYLKKLPISILKLDKAFIDDIAVNKTDNDIVKSIIILANTLNLSVVAEGVEEKDQLDCLVEFGCDMIQGYYISKPLPENEVEQVLKSC